MSTSVIIRLAGKNDAAAIAAISRKTFYDTFAEHNTPENMQLFLEGQFTEENLMAEVDAPGNIFLVALMENEMVGYARLREAQNPPELGNTPALELARIYSVQEAIGKGVGKALMLACIDIAREKEKKILWLGVWEHNQRAIAFYTRWGFEKFGSHLFILGRDLQTDWMMKKEI